MVGPAEPATPAVTGRLPRRFLLRFLFLVVLIAGGFALLRWTPLAELADEKKLVAIFQGLRDSPWAPLVLVASYVLLCPLGVPATPMMIAGGVIFGVWLGSLYNFVGTVLGAAASYYLARHLGLGFLLHILGGKLRRVERAVARQGFWGLLRVRFLPLPFALVNYSAALAGVKPAPYLASSAIALVPTSALFTYFAAALFGAAAGERSGMVLQLLLATFGLLALTFVPTLWTARRRRKRYREIRERRNRRGAAQT